MPISIFAVASSLSATSSMSLRRGPIMTQSSSRVIVPLPSASTVSIIAFTSAAVIRSPSLPSSSPSSLASISPVPSSSASSKRSLSSWRFSGGMSDAFRASTAATEICTVTRACSSGRGGSCTVRLMVFLKPEPSRSASASSASRRTRASARRCFSSLSRRACAFWCRRSAHSRRPARPRIAFWIAAVAAS